MRTQLLILTMLALGASALPAAAVPGPLDLPEAIRQVQEQHPLIRAAEAQLAAARGRETQARALPNPALTLQADELPVARPLSGNLMAGLVVPLTPGGLREARTEAARVALALAELDLEVQRQELALQVKLAYFRVSHDEQRVRLARETVSGADQLHQAARTRFAAGEAPRIEVYRTEVEQQRARRDLALSTQACDVTRRRLLALLQRPASASLTLADLPDATPSPLVALEEVRARALAASPLLRRAALQARLETWQLGAAQASRWQGYELGVAAGTAEGAPAVSTTLTLPLPLYRQQGEIAEAEAKVRGAEASLVAARGEALLGLEEAYGETIMALTRLRLIREGERPQAARFAANARLRYLAGEGSGLEAVEALRVQRDTEVEHQQALLSWREAIARFERVSGHDLPR